MKTSSDIEIREISQQRCFLFLGGFYEIETFFPVCMNSSPKRLLAFPQATSQFKENVKSNCDYYNGNTSPVSSFSTISSDIDAGEANEHNLEKKLLDQCCNG